MWEDGLLWTTILCTAVFGLASIAPLVGVAGLDSTKRNTVLCLRAGNGDFFFCRQVASFFAVVMQRREEPEDGGYGETL